MEHGAFELGKLGWFAGWLVAVALLFLAGAAPAAARFATAACGSIAVPSSAIVAAAVAVTVLANVALTLHDAHIDLTREKIYTPSQRRR